MELSITKVGGRFCGKESYEVDTIIDNKLAILGEFNMYDEATKFAREYMQDRAERGDKIWNWDGTGWQWTGRDWKAFHPSN